jgi:hypothetical protein
MFLWDISVAFTNANAEEQTYVRFPKSFPDDLFPEYNAGTIVIEEKLVRGQISTKLWYNCLYGFIIELGFKSVAGHPCLLIHITVVDEITIIIVIRIFVHDLLVAGNSVSEITKVRKWMNKRFILTDEGELEYYLGVEVSKIDQNTLLLHQTGYAKKVLERFMMTDCKPVKTPM